MKDYLSRLIEYEKLMKEIEIAGEEHLKIIEKNSLSYLKKAEELRLKVASDVFLTADDKEKMLKRISSYVEQVKSVEDKLEVNSFLLGVLSILAAKEGILQEFIEKVGEIFGVGDAFKIYSQKYFKNFNR